MDYKCINGCLGLSWYIVRLCIFQDPICFLDLPVSRKLVISVLSFLIREWQYPACRWIMKHVLYLWGGFPRTIMFFYMKYGEVWRSFLTFHVLQFDWVSTYMFYQFDGEVSLIIRGFGDSEDSTPKPAQRSPRDLRTIPWQYPLQQWHLLGTPWTMAFVQELVGCSFA